MASDEWLAVSELGCAPLLGLTSISKQSILRPDISGPMMEGSRQHYSGHHECGYEAVW